MLIISGKPQRVNKVEMGICGTTQTCNRAGVRGYFRLYKDNIQVIEGHSLKPVFIECATKRTNHGVVNRQTIAEVSAVAKLLCPTGVAQIQKVATVGSIYVQSAETVTEYSIFHTSIRIILPMFFPLSKDMGVY